MSENISGFDSTKYLDNAARELRRPALPMSPDAIVELLEGLLAWTALSGVSRRLPGLARSVKVSVVGPHERIDDSLVVGSLGALMGGRLFPCVEYEGRSCVPTVDGLEWAEPAMPASSDDNEEADVAYEVASDAFDAKHGKAMWAKGSLSEDILGEPLRVAYITQQPHGMRPLAGKAAYKVVLSGIFRGPDRIRQILARRPGVKVSGRLILLSSIAIDATGAASMVEMVAASEWSPSVYLDTRGKPAPRLGERIQDAYAAQWSRRYRWCIEVALSKGRNGIALETDVEGVRAFLRQRAAADGSRRAALIHWVSRHWRRRRPMLDNDAAGRSLIREHLRGAIECSFGGLHCRVYPSRFDLERACNGVKVDAKIAELNSAPCARRAGSGVV